jgi:hypothetical protein
MINSKIQGNPDPDPYNDPFNFDLSPEKLYAIHQRLHILSRIDDIKVKYCRHVYEMLALQNPEIKRTLYGVKNIMPDGKISEASGIGENIALDIISEHTIYCGDFFSSFFVLCNPQNAEPSVVTDVYDFLDTSTGCASLNTLREYIQLNKEKEVLFTEQMKNASKTVLKQGVKSGAGYGLGKAARHLASQAGRLQSIAKHYSPGHAVHMRVTSSYRGKAAQSKAFAALFRKSESYALYTARYKIAGTGLKWLAGKMSKSGGMPKPISMLDVAKPMETARYDTFTAQETSRMSRLIHSELNNYCEKNNNYQRIINQQYFEQG